MMISLIKGDARFLDECIVSLQDSDLGRFYFPNKEKAEEAINEFMFTDFFLVAVDDKDQFAGFICYLPTGAFHAFPYLHLLVTSSKMRGKGVGSKMMDIFEDRVFEQKDKLFLVVADFNQKGIEFYRKRGFLEVGIIPSLYRRGINEHLLMKTRESRGSF